ncbi:MAG: alpha-galactosidase [Caldilineales bacterium]|nr:alpha-galactosidase [Caldilineales bacterium]
MQLVGLGDWLAVGPHELFGVEADGRRWSARNLNLREANTSRENGYRQDVLAFAGDGLEVTLTARGYDDSALVECWPTVRNVGATPVTVTRLDSLSLDLAPAELRLLAFTGNWGSEFEPVEQPLAGETVLESRSGRSSKGNHPWFALFRPGGEALAGAVAWSGNWAMRFSPQAGGGFRLTGGLHDWAFAKTLAPGEALEAPPFVLAVGADLDDVAQQYARVGRRHWYPANDLSRQLPVEWNHWWPYEDAEINEAVFLRNVDEAARMGFEVCTLDAGWFGPSDPDTFWEHYRGDWHLVNARRFPNGIRKLADHVHAHGMKFGIWCEIEGLGPRAALAQERPDFVALRDGAALGYVCLGNPQAQEWAYATLARLVTEFGADWIKVDFNLDPGAGCNRTDHGHGPGDGLYAHVRGYYRVMSRLRRDFPHVLLENCSSGGLRIDLGTLRHTHTTFLSDPDYPEHDLQIFWGASTMLAANVLLHWTYSDWRNLNPPPYQTFDPHDPALTRERWDYMARASMLGGFGLSQKLPDLPAWLRRRIEEQIALYKAHVRRFVREADLYRLTPQPRRDGTPGRLWAAFQYRLPDGSEHLLFVFRLPGGEPVRRIRLKGLERERLYRVRGLEGEADFTARGDALMDEGLLFDTLGEQGSALLHLS